MRQETGVFTSKKTASKVNWLLSNFLNQFIAKRTQRRNQGEQPLVNTERCFLILAPDSCLLSPELWKHRPDFDDPVFRQFASIQ